MEIRVLRYFLTVVREESITRAAEVLHITQPRWRRRWGSGCSTGEAERLR